MIAAGEHVVVDYRLRLDDGTEYMNTRVKGAPVEFELGSGTMLPDFELAVSGMEAGESRSIHIPADRAYGQWDESLLVSMAPASLPDGAPLPEGAVVGLRTPDGVIRVKVVKANEDEVVVDCNHELAGKGLDFDITLVKVYDESLVERELHAKGCSCGCDRLQEQLG